MITTVFFVRHAEPDCRNHDDFSRELSAKGLKDRKLVTEFLSDKSIDIVLSSPFRRAVDTLADFAREKGLEIQIAENFKERIAGGWIEDYNTFCKAQWNDFAYKLPGGEALSEVQSRNIKELNRVLKAYKGKNIAIGSHGTALSTIINFYDNSFGFQDFEKIKSLMPWIVKATFTDDCCTEIKQYDVFRTSTP